MKNILLPFTINKNLKNEIIDFVYNSEKKIWTANYISSDLIFYPIIRKFCIISKLDNNLSKKINDFKLLLFNQLNIKEYVEEKQYGDFISVNLNRGKVDEHVDEPLNNWPHVRINFLIQKPIEGGMPIIEGVTYPVDEGQCWINKASEWVHGSTPVKGDIDRIVLSLGSFMPINEFNKIELNLLKKQSVTILL